ncbi:ATP-binding protein [Streptococcus dysgalactiae subsp. dysgalactiae]|nr:ATP-binding protein [Streptococcus dysgalactiae subsp. dysgalactiae]
MTSEGVWNHFNFEFNFEKTLSSENITLDRNLISRVIHNLIYNSILHNPNGCDISLYIRKGGTNYILVEITDNGIGKNTEPSKINQNINHLQFDISGAIRNGIGLQISEQIIKLHNGIFTVVGKKGHCFSVIIKLPINN